MTAVLKASPRRGKRRPSTNATASIDSARVVGSASSRLITGWRLETHEENVPGIFSCSQVRYPQDVGTFVVRLGTLSFKNWYELLTISIWITISITISHYYCENTGLVSRL